MRVIGLSTLLMANIWMDGFDHSIKGLMRKPAFSICQKLRCISPLSLHMMIAALVFCCKDSINNKKTSEVAVAFH